MTESVRSGSTRAAVPGQVRSARRTRKLSAFSAAGAIAAIAAIGVAQPLLVSSAPTQAAEAYQPSLADITRANPQSYRPASNPATDSAKPGTEAASYTITRAPEMTVELQPAPTTAPQAYGASDSDAVQTTDAGSAPAGTGSMPAAVSYDPATVQGQAQQYLQSIGKGDQWGCFDAIISQESRWDPFATNPSSGAYGIAQALPGEKMASAGDDWATNPMTQVRWAVGYMEGRYGSICAAYDFKFTQGNGWY